MSSQAPVSPSCGAVHPECGRVCTLATGPTSPPHGGWHWSMVGDDAYAWQVDEPPVAAARELKLLLVGDEAVWLPRLWAWLRGATEDLDFGDTAIPERLARLVRTKADREAEALVDDQLAGLRGRLEAQVLTEQQADAELRRARDAAVTAVAAQPAQLRHYQFRRFSDRSDVMVEAAGVEFTATHVVFHRADGGIEVAELADEVRRLVELGPA